MEQHTDPTQSREAVSQGLHGVREAARRDKGLKFTALLHHVNERLLLDSFPLLKKEAAPGVDDITWKEYEQGVEGRIADLHGRVHRGAYTGHSPHGGSTSRNRMAGNGHSGSRRWKTRSCSKLWQRSSIRFTRRTFSGFRMVFARGGGRMMPWMP